jgi:hypothetical protein
MALLISLISLFFLASSFTVKSIPSYNNPPQRRQLTSMCYESTSNSLWTYGGFEESGTYFKDLWRFDLLTDSWEIIIPLGYTAPCKA